LLRNLALRIIALPENVLNTIPLILAVMTLFALETKAGTEEQLAAYRQQIDSLDQGIVKLIQERAKVVEEIGQLKREAHQRWRPPGSSLPKRPGSSLENSSPGIQSLATTLSYAVSRCTCSQSPGQLCVLPRLTPNFQSAGSASRYG
jgi:hypothetical protein